MRSLTRWARNAFLKPSCPRRPTRRSLGWSECLEHRILLHGTLDLAEIGSADIWGGKSLFVPLAGSQTEGHAMTYTASSSNSSVAVEVLTGGRSLRMNVSGVDSGGQAFTGDLTFRLFENLAPSTTARIIELVNSGFYDDDNDIIFHRIIDDFMAQAGDPTGTGSGGSGTEFDDEFHSSLTFSSRGLLAMANSGDDTNDSQFFVVDTDLDLADLPQHLNFNHTIFGILTGGLETFEKVMTTPTNPSTNRPLSNVSLNSVDVFEDDQSGVLRVSAGTAFTGDTTITVTASSDGDTEEQDFEVTVVADAQNDRPFLGAVGNQTTPEGNAVSFDVTATDLEGDNLTFVVRDPNTFGQPANVTATVVKTSATTARVTLTPAANFSGTLNLLLGVRDDTNRAAPSALDSRANYDTEAFTLTVTGVNDRPIANAATHGVQPGAATQIQLTGSSGDNVDQTLEYILVGQPAHGTITNFNAQTGTLTYTPAAGFTGTDSFTFRVKDNGGTANGGQDTSATARVTLNVETANGVISGTVFRTSTVTAGNAPHIVYVVDVSASTRGAFNGTAVGDVDGDGNANTVFDAELAALRSLNQSLVSAGVGTTGKVSVVIFASRAKALDLDPSATGDQFSIAPSRDGNSNTVQDVLESLTDADPKLLRSVGIVTNFEAALVEARRVLTQAGTELRNAEIVFLSDGLQNTGGTYGDEAASLRSAGANVAAFGLGERVSMPKLEVLDQDAQRVNATNSLSTFFTNTSFGRTPASGVTLFLDLDADGTRETNEPTTTSSSTGTYSFTGLHEGTHRVRQVVPAGSTQIEPGLNAAHTVELGSGETVTGINFVNRTSSTSSASTLSAFSPESEVDSVFASDLDALLAQ